MCKSTLVLCCIAALICSAIADRTQFTLNFFKSAYVPHENTILSPIALQMGLQMMHHVATPEASRTMQDVLDFPDDDSEMKNLLSSIQRGGKVSMFSMVYYPQEVNLNPAFGPHLQEVFNATTEAVNFKKRDRVVRLVNSWVADCTRGAIRELLKPDDVSSLTTSLLINVIRMKAGWGFDGTVLEHRTQKRAFHFLNGDHPVDMMWIKAELPHLHLPDLKLNAIELAYEAGSDLSMIILLPNEDTTLEEAVQGFTIEHYRRLDELFTDRYWGNVVLHMPRFGVKQQLDAGNTLRKLGLGSLFDEESFQVLDGKLSKLGSVKQSTYIKIDENGTEAAAATSRFLLNFS